MKRVLMTADPLGGVWNYALELIHALPQIEFALCTMGAPISNDQRDALAALKNVSLFVSSYELEWMNNPWPEVETAGDWLLEIAASFRPDLIHLNGYSQASLPWSAPVIVVAHSCVLSWWRAVKREVAPRFYDEYRRRVAGGLSSAELVIAPSRSMLESLDANYDVRFTGRVIPNGCDRLHFIPGIKQPKILGAGRVWDDAKNLQALDAVAPCLKWRVEIAGDLSAPDGRTAALRHARWIGKLSTTQIRSTMASAAIFAAPARYEPFGLSILEAALNGCALVLGDIPSLRELWEDCAVFVDPENHAALARAINDCIDHRSWCENLSARARERSRAFSKEQMAAQYFDLYASLTSSRRTEMAA